MEKLYIYRNGAGKQFIHKSDPVCVDLWCYLMNREFPICLGVLKLKKRKWKS